MFVLIHNHDAFTFNLVQGFARLGVSPIVVASDDPALLDYMMQEQLERVCIASGTGRPDRNENENILKFLQCMKERRSTVPVLGVGLGHLLLCFASGALSYLPRSFSQGKKSVIEHRGKGMFMGLPNPLEVGRFDSWLVNPDLPECLECLASDRGSVMAVRHTVLPWTGVQFLPESILTPHGSLLLDNFLRFTGGSQQESDLVTAENTSELAAGEATQSGLSAANGEVHEPPLPLSSIFERLGNREDLSAVAARQVFSRLLDGDFTSGQAGALLLGLRSKGETALEMAMAAEAVLDRAVNVPLRHREAFDVVGTGGDGRNSFNCSTAVSLVLAGMGYPVVKHGNRSVSSRCGSADVIERLGYDLQTSPEQVQSLLDRGNFAFLFAPLYHPSFKNIMPIRKELGIRTLFNYLGPLVNPGKPRYRLVGAATPELMDLLAGTMAQQGDIVAAVVHGAGGYDELTPMGTAQVRLIREGSIIPMGIDPADYGFLPCTPEDVSISGPDDAVAVMRLLLEGKGPLAMRQMLALNVGLALFLRENKPLGACMEEAKYAVNSGVAREVLCA